ncbi:DUF4158 domain-containing protein [Streptomyces sp. NPDC056305]|uniref:DUF4158 domain-containing protein n=1 Tax=unclassified Streptomyces TaxID=2593676 RepID=UPI0035D6A7A3
MIRSGAGAQGKILDHGWDLATVRACRCIGLFLEDPLDVPWPVVEHLAEQLGTEDVSCVKEYAERLKTAYEHAWEIRDAYGYHPFEDHAMGRKFRAFLHGRARTAHAEGPKALFDHAVGWLPPGSLGLALNAVVLWTTRCIDAAVAQLRAEGHDIRDEDIARLSPLKHKNLNCLGRYNFTASQPVDGLRPLRDPDAVDLDDDGGEEE